MTAKHPGISAAKESLVCIGQGIRLSGGNLRMVADLFLSPDGTVSVAVRGTNGNPSEIARFISRVGFPGLDMIASDYFFKTGGQAAGIIDIMARYGHITFSDALKFKEAVTAGASFPIIFFIGRGHP